MSVWVYDEYSEQYCLMSPSSKKGNKKAILLVSGSYFELRKKFFEALGPVAVVSYQLSYPKD